VTLEGYAKREYQARWVAARRAAGVELLGGKCVECGSTEELEFDHVDPVQKISHRIWSWADARRLAELAKCQLLCAGCHLEKTRRYASTSLVTGVKNHHKKGCACRVCQRARDLERIKAFRGRTAEVASELESSPLSPGGSPPRTTIDRYEVFS
jgi:hypothetical protein